ncbi:DUF6468 domain-containing protein [Benzoatithermus flavus]|uniref:DUF6468 domain-containing protein n=1 Tax=Benzoatithermus flavus TaxID=3108223 RepID=A0ABU8XX23_9PROT
MLLATIMNMILIGFLTAWLVWWRRASRHIERFKEARAEMGALIGQLQEQIGVAQAEIARISQATRAALPEMQQSVARSEALLHELELVIASGERVADRIEAAARLAHVVSRPLLDEQPAPARVAARKERVEPAPEPKPVPEPAAANRPIPRKKMFRGRPTVPPTAANAHEDRPELT